MIGPILATILGHAAVARPHDLVSLEVEPQLAEEIAEFVEQLIHSGEFGGGDQPLLFSAHTGDLVVLVRDALVEIHISEAVNFSSSQPLSIGSADEDVGLACTETRLFRNPSGRDRPEPRTWRFLARGTRGRLVARRGDCGKVLLVDGPSREHAYVSDRSMTRARPAVQRRFLRSTG